VESHTAWNLNLGYTFLEEHRIGVNTMGAYAGDMGSPGYFVSIMPEEWTRRSNASVDFTYDGGYSPWGLSWNARYFNGANDYLNDSPLPGAWGDPVYFEQTTRYQGAQGQISFTRDFLTLTGGVDWLTSDMDQKSATLSYPNGSKSTIGGTGFFLLAKMAFFEDRLILNGGIRYDRYSLEIESRKDDLSHFTPSVGAAWRPLDWLTLRANYGESYRLPTSQELLGYNSLYLGWPLNYFGNPDLDPEKGKSWDAGFEVNYRSLNIGLTYFQTDYNNKIVTRPVGFDQQYYNLPGTTKYRGLEFQAGYDLGDAFGWPFMLRPYVSLTHLFKYDDPDGVKLNNIAEQDISAGIGFHHPDIGLTADLRVVYFGRQWQTDWTTGSPTYGQKVRTGGDATVDFFVSKTLRSWEKYGTLSLTGEIRNLFDVDYALYKDYPMPGRSFYLGLRYEF
jgi:vitamin B12 transporter